MEDRGKGENNCHGPDPAALSPSRASATRDWLELRCLFGRYQVQRDYWSEENHNKPNPSSCDPVTCEASLSTKSRTDLLIPASVWLLSSSVHEVRKRRSRFYKFYIHTPIPFPHYPGNQSGLGGWEEGGRGLYCELMCGAYELPRISDSNEGYSPFSWINIITFFT